MAGYILRGEEKSVVLKASDVDRLLQKGSGDAALLYLALQRLSGGITPERLMEDLQFTALRLSAAETVLQELGLIAPAAPAPERAAEECPVYSAEELAAMLESGGEFPVLVEQTEKLLGRRLKTADLQVIAGLYDDRGMSADVIYLLVSHCVERAERRYGQGRRPTLRQIEKVGYEWARRGIFSQEAAAAYLRQYDETMARSGGYMKVLGLDRPAAPAEQKYITDWIEKGFSPDAVALAYDRTVLKKKELNWAYLNGILRRWHENGWHSAGDVERNERQRGVHSSKKTEGDNDAWMEKYM